jgi:hydroxymethylpyrimidine pyrophosphatase-like HAD family hydrolase
MTSHYFRAIAVDFDGTLTENERPSQAVLDALGEVRSADLRIVLVTGRILRELAQVFPEAESVFDAIVAENGAVIWQQVGGPRAVAPAVSAALEEALRTRGIPVRRGQALLATTASYDQAIRQEITRLGLEDQLIRNRAALMVLPPGVNKGTGLLEALGNLGVSHHSTIGIGDAENDHSLFDVCELGVAVSNAVDGLKARADIVLQQPDGAGVLAFLRSAILREEVRVAPSRWEVPLGTSPEGQPVTAPGARANVLVTGTTRSGKSCLAGLYAERLMARGYSVSVLDPEGDHLGLRHIRGVVGLGGEGPLPGIELLRQLFQHGLQSTVIDLSFRPVAEKQAQCHAVVDLIARVRQETGLPHWFFIDEAHLVSEISGSFIAPGDPHRGLCLVTYRPDILERQLLQAIDIVFAMPGTDLAALAKLPFHLTLTARMREAAAHLDLTDLPAGWAVRIDQDGAQSFRVDQRAIGHLRHWHKYLHAILPPHRRFFFRTPTEPTGIVAANVAEFHDGLIRSDEAVLRHHAAGRDFSAWFEGVIRDDDLARQIGEIEANLRPESDIEGFRRELVGLIERWYPEQGVNPIPAEA